MNKLEMAHQMACAMMASNDGYTIGGAIECAWEYADAMHEENNERYKLDINKVLEGHEHVFIDGRICWCGKTKSDFESEWQPDWSQAPRHDVVAWDIDEQGQARWIASDNGYYLAPSFGYNGKWEYSLRKRP